MSSSPEPLLRFAIDRGGTFTDIYAQILRHNSDDPATPVVEERVLKLLSEDPQNYQDAPTEGIRRILEYATGKEHPSAHPVDTAHIASIRMGTTVATNALLERDGHPCALVTTRGMRDLLLIGNQARPNIFDLTVAKLPPLCRVVVEARERVVLDRNCTPHELRVRHPLDEDQLTNDLRGVRADGITSLAVALMHSYAFPQHEQRVREIALALGFTHVSLSSQLTPMVKIVPRAFTATVDAYLTPKLCDYIANFKTAFAHQLQDVDVQFMQSDGGLCHVDAFFGYVSLLSGPAGGVVGYARTAYAFETSAPERRRGPHNEPAAPLPVIGFDMGGTSTDVSRYAGRFEHIFETHTAGVTIQAPQLDINTVAAGGGSRLFFRAGMFYVGPESAGAHPGPVCYRKGGHLTVTDANVVLGRIQPALFPRIFGENADQPLDIEASRVAFAELTAHINAELHLSGKSSMSLEQVADGFICVANETMCRPIRELTEAKGHDVRDHSLACFGGAGGQHACAIANSLGIGTVFVHKYSGVLSAYGIAIADSVVETQQSVDVPYGDGDRRRRTISKLVGLWQESEKALQKRGFQKESIQSELFLNLRYAGTDFGIMVLCPFEQQNNVDDVDFSKLFEDEYSREHGFCIPGREIVIDDVRVRSLGSPQHLQASAVTNATIPEISHDKDGNVQRFVGDNSPTMTSKSYYDESGWLPMDVWQIHDLPKGKAVLPGPCMIVDSGAGNTVVVDPFCVARVASDGNILIDVSAQKASIESDKAKDSQYIDPVKVSIYSHRFMGIAEQMGRTLQRTSISTNIKERLDFSCALFDETGGLVANAPHVPVHLGAMQDAVRYQIRLLGSDWREGEVLLSNHPEAGGTHLPDITVITPIYFNGKVVFYVASRGHHADIGGTTPGSMPPFSTTLAEEGLAVRSLKLVKDGLFQEEMIIELLKQSGCRCLNDVVSDLRAQVAANQKGIMLMKELIANQGLETVQEYMHNIQKTAAEAVRRMLLELAQRHKLEKNGVLKFSDSMDDGTKISLTLTIDIEKGNAEFDFTESGSEVKGNTNAPRAITSSAILYALRCLVNLSIPLNQGCLDPITMKVRKASILNPGESLGVVGGNVLTSQRVTDVILGAFQACAASQGCMNNMTFGNETMGYYETIGGGSGAGPGWHGTSGVQSHMTNTRITDAEVLERRYPVVVREFALRSGSGGKGKWRGGDGIVRCLEFTETLTVSLLTERRVLRPWGLAGGEDGMSGKNEVIYSDGRVKDVGGRCSFDVEVGDMVKVKTPGGGGYGAVCGED